MSVFTREEVLLGNERFLQLCAFVEQTQVNLRSGSEGYDQRQIVHSCGAPACLLGHAQKKWPDRAFVHGFDEEEFFAINGTDWFEIFSQEGCDNAGTDWRKAVAFVRQFVADRAVSSL